MKYGELNLGQIEAVVNKLGGMEGVRRFLSGELVVEEAESQLKVWKTIRLGTGLRTVDDFHRALGNAGFGTDFWTRDILSKPTFMVATREIEVDLVKVTPARLGLRKGARRNLIYERAKDFGLELCPPEVGPQLCLQYQSQPDDKPLHIGMESIIGPNDNQFVFGIHYSSSKFRLATFCGYPSYFWRASSCWVFCLPRK
ncbi:MAG: hypothetical protein ABIF89_00170 [bacterium]